MVIMEKWRSIWRRAFVPQLSRQQLEALQWALIHDDQRLLQGTTCFPPSHIEEMRADAVEGACALSFCGWQGSNIKTVGELDQFFQTLCDNADVILKEAGACRYWINWADDTPRDQFRREMILEVASALKSKEATSAA
jgi:hypothetical protein